MTNWSTIQVSAGVRIQKHDLREEYQVQECVGTRWRTSTMHYSLDAAVSQAEKLRISTHDDPH